MYLIILALLLAAADVVLTIIEPKLSAKVIMTKEITWITVFQSVVLDVIIILIIVFLIHNNLKV